MSALRVITVKILVREDDADEVTHGVMNLLCHDASIGAFARDTVPTQEDRDSFSDQIADLEDDQ